MQRPKTATIFGVLTIFFAWVSVARFISALMAFFGSTGNANSLVKIIQGRPGAGLWLMFSACTSVVAILMFLIAGIGLIQSRTWARSLSIGLGYFGTLFGVVCLVANFFILMPVIMENVGRSINVTDAWAVLAGVHGPFGGLLILYPMVLMAFMYREKIVGSRNAKSST